MRLEKSEETASEGRKRLSQSGNKAQWQMCLAEKSEEINPERMKRQSQSENNTQLLM